MNHFVPSNKREAKNNNGAQTLSPLSPVRMLNIFGILQDKGDTAWAPSFYSQGE